MCTHPKRTFLRYNQTGAVVQRQPSAQRRTWEPQSCTALEVCSCFSSLSSTSVMLKGWKIPSELLVFRLFEKADETEVDASRGQVHSTTRSKGRKVSNYCFYIFFYSELYVYVTFQKVKLAPGKNLLCYSFPEMPSWTHQRCNS